MRVSADTLLALTFVREIKSPELERQRHIHGLRLDIPGSVLFLGGNFQTEIVKQQVRATFFEFWWLRRCPWCFTFCCQKEIRQAKEGGKKNSPNIPVHIRKTV